jgi:hypothetical protein
MVHQNLSGFFARKHDDESREEPELGLQLPRRINDGPPFPDEGQEASDEPRTGTDFVKPV